VVKLGRSYSGRPRSRLSSSGDWSRGGRTFRFRGRRRVRLGNLRQTLVLPASAMVLSWTQLQILGAKEIRADVQQLFQFEVRQVVATEYPIHRICHCTHTNFSESDIIEPWRPAGNSRFVQGSVGDLMDDPPEFDARSLPRVSRREHKQFAHMKWPLAWRHVKSRIRSDEPLSVFLTLYDVSEFGFSVLANDLTWIPSKLDSQNERVKRAEAAKLIWLRRIFKTPTGATLFLRLSTYVTPGDADAELVSMVENPQSSVGLEKFVTTRGPTFSFDGLRNAISTDGLLPRDEGNLCTRVIYATFDSSLLRVGLGAGEEPWPWETLEVIWRRQVEKFVRGRLIAKD
jgi:hypothetical protein